MFTAIKQLQLLRWDVASIMFCLRSGSLGSSNPFKSVHYLVELFFAIKLLRLVSFLGFDGTK